ncbi:hypothetical protein ACFV2U_07570 [Streptomyces sp. NPDC059697]|uniref:hypothetical protein n=1 Tax=Streptomyces sp. NPDC059697 TaxID=3346912 RepID=UPI0036B70B43
MGDMAELGLTVVEVVRERWGVVLPADGLIARFTEPGWTYEGEVARPCPECDGRMHSLRRPYESAGRVYRYVAVVCPVCPAAYTLAAESSCPRAPPVTTCAPTWPSGAFRSAASGTGWKTNRSAR